MKREQIDALRATAKHGVSAFINPVAHADAILRLLAEREKLLEALREYVCFDCGWHADDEVARRYDCSRCRSTANALAFVEEDLTHG